MGKIVNKLGICNKCHQEKEFPSAYYNLCNACLLKHEFSIYKDKISLKLLDLFCLQNKELNMEKDIANNSFYRNYIIQSALDFIQKNEDANSFDVLKKMKELNKVYSGKN